MGRKPILEDQEQGICILCNTNKQQLGPKSKLGFKKYVKFCTSCLRKKYGIKRKRKKTISYRKYKKLSCERCGFKAVDRCQLDVHHIDRDRKNNNIENLLTLCSNCHRLEHKGEYI